MHHGCLIFCLSRFERVITSHVHTESLLFGRFPSRSEKRHGHDNTEPCAKFNTNSDTRKHTNDTTRLQQFLAVRRHPQNLLLVPNHIS